MSTWSETKICNIAMFLLGAKRISSRTEDSPNARYCDEVFDEIRDRELGSHPWNFAKSRASLAAHATAPAFEFNYAYPLPDNYIDLLTPKDRADLDWQIENHEDARCILTNDSAPLEINYIKRVTDVTLFHPVFCYALACALADTLCEKVTQSNSKKATAQTEYLKWIGKARQRNAFANVSQEPPEDKWVSVRRG